MVRSVLDLCTTNASFELNELIPEILSGLGHFNSQLSIDSASSNSNFKTSGKHYDFIPTESNENALPCGKFVFTHKVVFSQIQKKSNAPNLVQIDCFPIVD